MRRTYLAHEALGLAIGRLSVSNPVARIALVSGYTRAIREHVAGGAVRSDDGNARELAAAGELLEAAHGVTPGRAAEEAPAPPQEALTPD